jgi:hypothetical protein
MTRLMPFFLPLCFAAALAAPSDTHACSIPVPEAFTLPVNLSSSPANAAIAFGGYHRYSDEEFAELAVTIDGIAARLQPIEASGKNESIANLLRGLHAVAVSPEPGPGQRVVVSGPAACGFSGADDSSGECPPFELAYTATEPDVTPPAVPAVTYEARYTRGICGTGNLNPVYDVYIPPPLEGGAAAPVMYLIEAFRDATLTDRVDHLVTLAERASHTLRLSQADAIGCVRIQAFDLAGNESPPAVECALPAVPPPPPDEDEDEAKDDEPERRQLQSATSDGCRLAGAVGAGPAPWAPLLAASALFAGRLRRRGRARRGLAARASPPGRGRRARHLR